MSEIIKPTKDNFYNEELESVGRDADDSWRHGCHICEVFHRSRDDTYWQVAYDLSSDGETHGLRDGCYTMCQVRRVEKQTVVVTYEKMEAAV